MLIVIGFQKFKGATGRAGNTRQHTLTFSNRRLSCQSPNAFRPPIGHAGNGAPLPHHHHASPPSRSTALHRLTETLTAPGCNAIFVATERGSGVRWTWDPDKAAANRARHGLSFETAVLVFEDPLHASKPDPHPDGDRWHTIGLVGPVLFAGDPHLAGSGVRGSRAGRPHHQSPEGHRARKESL